MHDKAQIWYAEQVQAQIPKGIAPESASDDLKKSILKTMHAKWATQYYNHILLDKDIVKNGWCRFGITKVIKENICNKDPFENKIILDLYFYGHRLKKTRFGSSLIFVKVY